MCREVWCRPFASPRINRVAVSCSVLQRVAVCCSVLQWVVKLGVGHLHRLESIVLQWVAVSCSALQRVAVCCSVLQWVVKLGVGHLHRLQSIVLQWFQVCCSVLQWATRMAQYGVALVSRIDKIICLFCKRALQQRQYSAKGTYNLIDPIDRSHPIAQYSCTWPGTEYLNICSVVRWIKHIFGYFSAG